MADFECDFLQAGSNSGQNRQIVGMQIPRENLRSDRSRVETETGADFLFRFGTDMRERAHRTRYFAGAHLFGGGGEACAMARKFIPPQRGLKAKRDGLGVHAVRAAYFY